MRHVGRISGDMVQPRDDTQGIERGAVRCLPVACDHRRGNVSSLRVALGAAGPTPVFATEVMQALQGKAYNDAAIRSAAEAVAGQVDPLDDFRGSSGYKRDMAVVFTRRALEQVLG